MIKVSYLAKENKRFGYIEEVSKRFFDMNQAVKFMNTVRLNPIIDGKVMMGIPLIEDSVIK